VASDGTVYVADAGNYRIQYFSAIGDYLGQWGSWGSGEGQFASPRGVAVASDGTVYVTDGGNDRIQRFSATGDYLEQWGSGGLGEGQFDYPSGVAVAADGMVYVADLGNDRIQYFSATGDYLGQWGSYGSVEGQFNSPSGMTVGPDGTAYVADTYNDRIQYFSATGDYLGQWGSYGSGEGQFDYPYDVAVASDGTVYVADLGNDRIQYFSATGDYLGQWGSAGSGEGQFSYPDGVAVASDETVYVVDRDNDRIQYFSATGDYLGQWGNEGSGEGQFNSPSGVAVASDGTVYVADASNFRIQYFSAIGDYLGQWGSAGTGEGEFILLHDVAVASDGTVYVTDTNYTVPVTNIQHFSTTGNFLGRWGSTGSGVTVASDGTIYVADRGNDRIRVFGTAYPETWHGEYFGNRWLAERPLLIRNETDLVFDWGAAAPDPRLPSDNFSARWQKHVYFEEPGDYRFTLTVNDGGRLWVGDRLLIEEWRHPQEATFEARIRLEAGYHPIRLEYYKYEGEGQVALNIEHILMGHHVYLPLTLRDYVAYFAGPWEVEPNDSYLQANGPLMAGRTYSGYPNDQKDYFSLYVRQPGEITVELAGHTGQGVQLQLFYQGTHNRVRYDTTPPYQITYQGSPGWYYVYIYTASGHNWSTPYTLQASYPE
jgi:sugar lactone lactonase YvrE